MPRILLLHASVGMGHQRAAQAQPAPTPAWVAASEVVVEGWH